MKNIYLILMITLFNCIATEPFYLVTQGYYQIRYILQREKIEKIKSRIENHPELMRKLELLEKVKSFAESELNLNIKNQFNYYLQIQQDYISYIVIASESLRLKPVEYWFPIAGKVQYLGFFEKKDAIQYSEYLKQKGYDVKISGVSAYSTLGWFSDPLLSVHIQYSDEDFISLIIHELTHNTFWEQKNNIFNETLATFVEEKGTILFLKKFYSQDESVKKINKYTGSIRESIELKSILFKYREKLEKIYNSNLEKDQKIMEKQKLFDDLKNKLVELKNQFKYVSVQGYLKKNFNNADFVLLNLYDNSEYKTFFEKIYNNCMENFQCFWEVLKNNTRKNFKNIE